MSKVRKINFLAIIEEVADEYGVDRDVVLEQAEEILRDACFEFFGGIEADVYLGVNNFKITLFKDEDIVNLELDDLRSNLIRGLAFRLRKELGKRCEIERVWNLYRYFKRKIKSLIKGKIIHFNGQEFYVEITDGMSRKFIAFCAKADMPLSGRDGWRKGKLKGEEKYFGIKNVVVEEIEGILRLKIMLTRQSKFFVESLFRLFNYHGKIYEIKRVPYKVKVWVENKVPKEVIKQVARELDEGVIVKYGNK